MTVLNYREPKPTPEAEALYRRWLANLNEEFTRHASVDRRSEIVRDELYQMYLGRPHGGRTNTTLISELATNSLNECFDPRNITLEPEYYGDVDPDQYAIRKPLIYFWQMFDRSPFGLNHWLGFRFRCMLGRHIFKHLGKHVKSFTTSSSPSATTSSSKTTAPSTKTSCSTTAAASSSTKAPASPTTPTSTPTPTTSTTSRRHQQAH